MDQAAKDLSKEIKRIKNQLREPGKSMLDLRGDKVCKYLDYRLEHLVSRRIVLLSEEQRYLLSETGPSPLRFDPEVLGLLINNVPIIGEQHHSERQIKEIMALKEEVAESLAASLSKEKLWATIKANLESHLGDLEIINEDPLIFKGVLDGRSVMIFFYNNGWVLPNNDLIKDLKYAHQRDCYPVFIAKKIHGVIFPYFKAIGVQGFNLYSALITPEDMAQYNKLNAKLKVYEEVSYVKTNTSYQARVDSTNILTDTDSPLAKFLDNMAKQLTLSDFLKNFKMSKHSFAGQAASLSGQKVRDALVRTDTKRNLLLGRLSQKLQQ